MSSSLMRRFPKLEHVNILNILTPMVLECFGDPWFFEISYFFGGGILGVATWDFHMRMTTLTPSYHAENYSPDDNRGWDNRGCASISSPYEIHRSWKWTSSFWDMSRSPFLGEVHHTSPPKKMSRNSFYPTWCPQRCLISPFFLGKNHLPKWFCRWTSSG